MKARRSLATTSFAGVVLAMTIATGAAPSLCAIEREVAQSYHSAVHAYDRARTWGLILRWWIDPEYGSISYRQVGDTRPAPKAEDVCQARPVAVR